MRISLPIKLMVSYLVVAGLVVAPTLLFLRGSLLASLEDSEVRELRGTADVVRARVALLPEADLDRTVRDYARMLQLRITVIDKDGVVVTDSDLTPEKVRAMENHRDRPEVKVALDGDVGHAMRQSATLGVEFVYVAVPLSTNGVVRAVLRVARPAVAFHEAVHQALLPQRLAAGVAVSAAIGLSFFGAFYVAWPLRRMRDAARAFANSRWVTVKRLRSGDELEELSVALDELGTRLREQLVEVGAQEALLTQAVRAFPVPAVVFRPDLTPLLVNGAFRRFAEMTATNEEERLTLLSASARLRAARDLAERSGLPTEMSLPPPGQDEDGVARRALLAPLARPNAPSLWLLVADLDGPESEAHGPEPVHRLLRSAEMLVERLWQEHPDLHEPLAQLRLRLDDAAHAAGRSEPVGVEPVDVAELLRRCAEEVTALHPRASDLLQLDLGPPASWCKVAESAGLGARAIRAFLRGGLRALPPGRTLEVSLRIEPTEVRVVLEGAAPADLEPVRELARALGTDAERVPSREREAAWLALPRA